MCRQDGDPQSRASRKRLHARALFPQPLRRPVLRNPLSRAAAKGPVVFLPICAGCPSTSLGSTRVARPPTVPYREDLSEKEICSSSSSSQRMGARALLATQATPPPAFCVVVHISSACWSTGSLFRVPADMCSLRTGTTTLWNCRRPGTEDSGEPTLCPSPASTPPQERGRQPEAQSTHL